MILLASRSRCKFGAVARRTAAFAKQRGFSTARNPVFRNLAIVAHVDHGKTTLVDALLSACTSTSHTERTMDSGDLEKERGITILSKVTNIKHGHTHLNLVDTPGHGDFSGEVERALSMVDGICLLVDATDGPMPTTRYVLKKAVKFGLKPIVVINKADNPRADFTKCEDAIMDLFLSFECSDEQLEYKTLYASGRDSWAAETVEEAREIALGNKPGSIKPLLDAFVSELPAPAIEENEPFKMLVSIIDSDPNVHKGDVLLTGKIQSGTVRGGDKVAIVKRDIAERQDTQTVIGVFAREGMTRMELDEATPGNIITLSGLSGGRVGDTVCHPEVTEGLPAPEFDPPTMSVLLSVNDSELAGNEKLSGGKRLTLQKIKDRLLKEVEVNSAIQIQFVQGDRDEIEVFGRGELHLGVLIENMRREGFEMSVSKPSPVMTRKDGVIYEPIEEVEFTFPVDQMGLIMQEMANRKGSNTESSSEKNEERMVFVVPTRTIVGLRQEITRLSGGKALMNTVFHGYSEYIEEAIAERKGVLVANATGVATSYAVSNLEKRGTMFIKPGEAVYKGMVVGELTTGNRDSEAAITKEKRLTNVRSVSKDEMMKLTAIREFKLEDCIGYVGDDELIEVTPRKIRMRKLVIGENGMSNQKRTKPRIRIRETESN